MLASLVSYLFLFLFLLSFPSPSTSDTTTTIRQACRATRFPDSCEFSLSSSHDLPTSPTPLDVILSAMNISAHNLQTAQSMVQTILNSAGSNKNRTNAAQNCLEFLDYSDHRITLSASSLPAGRGKDARAWMSAALLHQYDCFSALKYVNTTKAVDSAMAFLIRLSELTSNALSMLAAYDRLGPDTEAWRPPQTEREGVWEDMSAPAPATATRNRIPAVEEADVTVCRKGCDYGAVQAAVEAAPANLPAGRWFTIYIKEGVYEEIVRVPLEKTSLVFLGDGMGKTVITGSLNAGMVAVSTYNTATVAVAGDGFMARQITFENRAGPDAHQAVAFRSTADRTVVAFCEFLGHQDTLYAHALRQYYFACNIYGTVDFVFGNSATVFENCLFLVEPRPLHPEKGENNAVTAHGRTDPAQSTGFVIRNSNVNGTEEYMHLFRQKPRAHRNYLGRPWKEYARTVFTSCNLEALIRPEGWMPWNGDFALRTLYYGEYQSSGDGGTNVSARVPWSNQIPAEHVGVYMAGSFIQGDEWIPDF